ncbi:hypothetical protein OVA21_19060 [Dietzia sp. SL131]|uniref:hypothetical protein n=1 Tax=Dietzia sp. SL131 TaxID=2995149 RepID=UPI00227AE36E|nr:hypothetical protein [Dietzia sp. SL131]MCY1659255.1 hypothetical protein [Dietzia sp. SL131]
MSQTRPKNHYTHHHCQPWSRDGITVRYYINHWCAELGLLTHTQEGTSPGYFFEGTAITSTQAHKLRTSKAWVDDSGTVHLDRFTSEDLLSHGQALTHLQRALSERGLIAGDRPLTHGPQSLASLLRTGSTDSDNGEDS